MSARSTGGSGQRPPRGSGTVREPRGSGRLWPAQAISALLLAGGAMMPYAPWLITGALPRLLTMFALLAAGLLVYGITVRRSGIPLQGSAPTPLAAKIIFGGVALAVLGSSLIIESIHAPLWFPLVVVIAALLFLALHLGARSRRIRRP